MKALNQAATRVFQRLTDGLGVGEARKIENSKGFMAVHVDVLARSGPSTLVAVAHRFEMNGDLVPDPDMEFLAVATAGGELQVYPLAIDQQLGYSLGAVLAADMGVAKLFPGPQASMTQFANMWMMNIEDQQGLGKDVL